MRRRTALAFLAGLLTPLVAIFALAVIQHYHEAVRRESIEVIHVDQDGRWSA